MRRSTQRTPFRPFPVSYTLISLISTSDTPADRAYLWLSSMFFAVLGFPRLWHALGFAYVSAFFICFNHELTLFLDRMELLHPWTRLHMHTYTGMRDWPGRVHDGHLASLECFSWGNFSREPRPRTISENSPLQGWGAETRPKMIFFWLTSYRLSSILTTWGVYTRKPVLL